MRPDTESVIGPSDEEEETDTVDFSEALFPRGRSNSLRPSNASVDACGENRSVRTTPSTHSLLVPNDRRPGLTATRSPSTRSLRRVRSNVSGSSGGSVIRLVDSYGPSDLPYTIDIGGIASNRSNRF